MSTKRVGVGCQTEQAVCIFHPPAQVAKGQASALYSSCSRALNAAPNARARAAARGTRGGREDNQANEETPSAPPRCSPLGTVQTQERQSSARARGLFATGDRERETLGRRGEGEMRDGKQTNERKKKQSRPTPPFLSTKAKASETMSVCKRWDRCSVSTAEL